MNAEEARKKALSVTQGKSQQQYIEIKSQIDAAVEDGKLGIYYYKNLLPAVKEKLKEEHFNIEDVSNQHDGIIIVISW